MDNENSCFFAPVDTISSDSPTHINASILLEGCFVSCLDNICYSWTIFEVSDTSLGINFYFYCGTDKIGKIVLYLVSIVWVSSGKFLSSYFITWNKQHIERKENREILGLIVDRRPLVFYSLLIFISRPWNKSWNPQDVIKQIRKMFNFQVLILP